MVNCGGGRKGEGEARSYNFPINQMFSLTLTSLKYFLLRKQNKTKKGLEQVWDANSCFLSMSGAHAQMTEWRIQPVGTGGPATHLTSGTKSLRKSSFLLPSFSLLFLLFLPFFPSSLPSSFSPFFFPSFFPFLSVLSFLSFFSQCSAALISGNLSSQTRD